MIKPEQIPTEAWTAATIRLEALRYVCTGHNIREAIAAAINAWPDMRDIPGMTHDGDVYHRMLHLPVIPKEKNDD